MSRPPRNDTAARAGVRSEIDFENNVRAEIWSVHVEHALGLDVDHVESVVNQVIDGYRIEATRSHTLS